MSRLKKLSLTKLLRGGLIAVLVLVIFTISWYFVFHRRPAPVPPVKVEDITPQKVERQEGIEHLYARGKRVIQAKADRYSLGEDNRYYLEGNVEIRERVEEGKPEIFISGDKARHSQDFREAYLEGKAKLKYGDLTAESDAFSYEQSLDLLSTDQGVVFSSERLSGKALKMAYSFKDESIRLEGGVELKRAAISDGSSPLVIGGDFLMYSRRSKKGSGTGNITFSLGESHGQADSAEFALTADEQYLVYLLMKGNVKAQIIEDQAAVSSGGSIILSKASERELSADEINLKGFMDRPKVDSLVATGHSFLISSASSGELAEVRSEDMHIVFTTQGGLRKFRALRNANMVEKGKDGEAVRTMSGKEIMISTLGASLQVLAGEEGEARVNTADSEITARRISLDPRKEILNAQGQVKAILRLQPEKADSGGFFSTETPVFITCQGLRYEKDQERLFLRENIRMWQEKKMLFAEKLSVLKKTMDLSGEGRVRTVFPFLPKKEGEKEDRLEMGGEKMNLSTGNNLLTYEQNCWLKTQKIDLKSDSLFAYLQEKKGEVQRIEAKGKVVITEQLKEGRGAQAVYDVEKETIVLTGNPTLVEKDKGVIEGDKLTFHLGDGKITVENKDRERSVTVIKS